MYKKVFKSALSIFLALAIIFTNYQGVFALYNSEENQVVTQRNNENSEVQKEEIKKEKNKKLEGEKTTEDTDYETSLDKETIIKREEGNEYKIESDKNKIIK